MENPYQLFSSPKTRGAPKKGDDLYTFLCTSDLLRVPLGGSYLRVPQKVSLLSEILPSVITRSVLLNTIYMYTPELINFYTSDRYQLVRTLGS